MADYDDSLYYMNVMARRRAKLLAAFMQVIARNLGDSASNPADQTSVVDVLDTLAVLHARMIVGTDGGPLSWRRLADMQCQQIHGELTKLQDAAEAAA